MPRYALIDCGTNTFHLLIAEPYTDAEGHPQFREIYRERIFIKLAEDGIQTLGAAAYERALTTLRRYAKVIDQHAVDEVRVSGTEAFRSASNGPALRQQVKNETGLDIQIIPGDEEARLIQKGVAWAIGPQEGRWMVMDIGGGSVEFIIVDELGVRWYDSFPVGVAVIYKHFHRTEPITTAEIAETQAFLSGQLARLSLALAQYPVRHLVGAAGTFDVLAEVLGCDRITPHATRLDLHDFESFYQRILQTTREQRYAMAEVPADRADMIVVALILVKFVLEQAKIEAVTVSNFSMKEGMLAELVEAGKES
jgi:exopolyphosphatase/guanosine-5'-triphosphate,3'-diphosphate pyrophosphatase